MANGYESGAKKFWLTTGAVALGSLVATGVSKAGSWSALKIKEMATKK